MGNKISKVGQHDLTWIVPGRLHPVRVPPRVSGIGHNGDAAVAICDPSRNKSSRTCSNALGQHQLHITAGGRRCSYLMHLKHDCLWLSSADGPCTAHSVACEPSINE